METLLSGHPRATFPVFGGRHLHLTKSQGTEGNGNLYKIRFANLKKSDGTPFLLSATVCMFVQLGNHADILSIGMRMLCEFEQMTSAGNSKANKLTHSFFDFCFVFVHIQL